MGGSPEWTDLDRDKAIAYLHYARTVCSCGTRLEEWDPEQGGDRNAYVSGSLRCEGCVRIAEELEQIPKESARGIRAYLRRRTPEDA